METSKKIPAVILNGFLGSGKTTLFRNLLGQSNTKDIPVCAIVNDMSELDVDGELLGTTDAVEENSSIMESIHNCLLSSDKGIEKLDQAIERLLAKHQPKLIIIETSGSCHPMPLVEYFKEQNEVQLIGVFALIDSLMLSHDFNYGEQLIPRLQQNLSTGKRDTVNLLVEQVMFCSHLFLTKSDRIEKDKLPHIASYIQQINPYASTHSLSFGRLEIEALFDLPEYDYFKVAQLVQELKPVLEAESKDDRPYNMATRVIKDDRPFHPQRLWNICHEYLDQRIYRSKGFFWLASRDKHSLLWNQVAGGISLEIIGSWRSGILEDPDNGLIEEEIVKLKEIVAQEPGRFGDRHCDLTVIGDESQVDRFTDALKSCFLTDKEIELWKNGFSFEDPWPKNIVRIKNV
ncbi:GTP-binding protein [Flammeovirga sp. EKP202]|uniref:CobW family GTP-binding protein n=1 Tax=Flammeovirga sp. EKP202 TaxID=2770592 RepID=UPI00165FBD9A|nr:GTP-binding protein [Flammeovirga sp. EKP202]MBD0404240.1 GTP-binding protein [Flammeovirga sp. EKP202]